MLGSNGFRVSVSLAPLVLPQRSASYQRITVQGVPAYEILLLQEGMQVNLPGGLTLSRPIGRDPEISISVTAANKDQAWIQARAIVENLISVLTLALGRPLGQLDESQVFVSPDPPSGLVAAQRPNIGLSPTISDNQLISHLGQVNYQQLLPLAQAKQKNLDLALRWCHLAGCLEDASSSYIACWVGIEVLTEGLLRTNKHNVNYYDIKRAVSDSGVNIADIDRTIRRLENLRGSIVHRGEGPTEQELAEVRELLKNFIVHNAT